MDPPTTSQGRLLCYNGVMQVTRLYPHFQPSNYDLFWDLSDISNRRIRGAATIAGIASGTDELRLHAKELDIISVTLNDTPVADFRTEGDELVISARVNGTTTVHIDFSLTVTDAMHGIYPCYYTLDGIRHELYATQFESHHAREAFPCIDEPEAKATYTVSLKTTDGLQVLGNMPVASTQLLGASRTTTFVATPRMSSYLVAFVVGDLQRATTTTQSGVEVNVYATKAHPAVALNWALEHAAQTIDYFDDYFGVPYPLPKSDHVALPDFSSGAMENWGLITYREIALLADPTTVSIGNKQYVAEVVAHELSHQWFGNLVTMKWWDNLWLNESFATIMEYLAPNTFHPDWDLWFEFSTNEGVMALRRDCIDGVQPVQVAVNHPDEINSLFDGAIVYAKGGRLMRMMQTWIGDAAFRKGLKDYFSSHQYGNTTGDDLWDALSAASGKDVGALMNTWISQSGYPVVHAALANGQLTLRQEQFFVGPHEPSSKLWPIPLRANQADLPELLDTASLTIPFTSTDALHLNADDSGHYIVNYDDELRSRIIAELKAGNVSNIQRAQFLHEQMMLARGGYTSSAQLIELLDAYRDESNEKVWGMISLAIADLKRFVETNSTAEAKLRVFVGSLAEKQFERLGWDMLDGESEDDTQLRGTIIGCMLYSERPEIIAHAIDLYSRNTLEQLDPELRSLIMGAAVRHGSDATVVDTLITTYQTTSATDIQSDITSAVTSSKDHAVLQRLITMLTDTKIIRSQDTVRWYVNLLRNREGRDTAWQWLRDNWAWVETTFASDKSHDYFPRYSANILGTQRQLQEYKDFFTPLRDNPSLTRAIDMGILDLEGRIAIIERDTPAVIAALNKF